MKTAALTNLSALDATPANTIPDNTYGAPDALENHAQKDQRFAPSDHFVANAVAKADLYAEAEADRPAFWARQARRLLTWSKDFTRTLDWSGAPVARWFEDGELNAAYNALDRHVEAGHGDRVAIYFEGEPGDTRTLT